MAEALNSLYKHELIHLEGPWAGQDDVEAATAGWVHWFNTERLHSMLDYQTGLRRFDLEHTFRFLKQTLGWTRPHLRGPAAADRWTWLILASIKKLVQALKPLRTVTIDVNGHELTAAPAITADVQELLDKISAHAGH